MVLCHWGSCSATIHSSSPGKGLLTDLGVSQHGPSALALTPHQHGFWLKDWGQTGLHGGLIWYPTL